MALKKRMIPRQTFVRQIVEDLSIPADPARVRAMIDKLRQKLTQPPARSPKYAQSMWQPVAVGHGANCVCQVCYPLRLNGARNERQAGDDFEEDIK